MIREIEHEEISQLLEKNLTIHPIYKEKYGEINTPEILIQQMLDKLPKHIWRDPNKKWLDPASGIGSFQMLVYERLLKGLEYWEPNFKKRHNHIIQNMLYMCEINSVNEKKSRNIFGKNANIQKCDFLKMKHPNFQVKTFDVILGNPPFNSNKKQNVKSSANTIWSDFVEKSLTLLEKNGFLLYVHPSGWRKPCKRNEFNHLFHKMTVDCQMEYLEIHSKEDGLKTFGVQTRYDWYVLRNTPCIDKTMVKDENGKIQTIDLRKWVFLPNCYYSQVKELLTNDKTSEVIYSRNQYGTDKSWTRENDSMEYKYPLVHSTPKEETRYYWTNTKHPDVKNSIQMFGISKVIFGESGIHNVIVDVDGKYGMTQGAMALKIENEKHGLDLKHALESRGFEDILKALNFGNFRIDWRIFLYLKHDFYKHFLEEEREKQNIFKTNKKHSSEENTIIQKCKMFQKSKKNLKLKKNKTMKLLCKNIHYI
jgi:hypothetical protein